MVTLEEVVAHFRELERDPECREPLDVLLDLSRIDSLPSAVQLRGVALELKTIQNVRFDTCAVVAVKDAVFGMLRMFEVMVQNYFRAIRVFRASAEAEAWLVSQRRHSPQSHF
jgi:hypothetical protein